MATCLCDTLFDDVAQASVEVLEWLGVEVVFPADQTCCGQPAFNCGDWQASRRVARHTARVFAGELPVVVPSGSCAAMHHHGNPLQFEEVPDAQVASLGARTWEICDFIVNGLGVTRWPGRLARPTRVAFHQACHTRGSASGAASATLLASVGNLELVPINQAEQCCGFGGTFAVTFPHLSGRIGTLKLDHVLETRPDLLASTDSSCLMHLGGLASAQGRGLPVRHVIQILRDALNETAP